MNAIINTKGVPPDDEGRIHGDDALDSEVSAPRPPARGAPRLRASVSVLKRTAGAGYPKKQQIRREPCVGRCGWACSVLWGTADGVSNDHRKEKPALAPNRWRQAAAYFLKFMMRENDSALRLAPPTSAPSMSAQPMSSSTLASLTEPPYWMITSSATSWE